MSAIVGSNHSVSLLAFTVQNDASTWCNHEDERPFCAQSRFPSSSYRTPNAGGGFRDLIVELGPCGTALGPFQISHGALMADPG